jgi:hypothetical protein
MSHFTRIKTRLVKKAYLVQALRDLGHQPQEGEIFIRGYGGQKTAVEVMIPTQNPGYDLGFKKAGDTYELVADWFGIKDIPKERFLDQLHQRYAYCAVLDRLAEQGFELVEEEELADKAIHLTVRRAVF